MGQGPEYHGATEEVQTPPLTLPARVSCTPPQALAKENQLARVQQTPPQALVLALRTPLQALAQE